VQRFDHGGLKHDDVVREAMEQSPSDWFMSGSLKVQIPASPCAIDPSTVRIQSPRYECPFT